MNHAELARKADESLSAAIEVYQEVQRDIVKYSLLSIAHTLLDHDPNITGLGLEYSDQGPHMTTWDLLVGDHREDMPDEDLDNAIWGEVSNLDEDGTLWRLFCFQPIADQERLTLDLHKIIDHGGDYTRLLPKEDS